MTPVNSIGESEERVLCSYIRVIRFGAMFRFSISERMRPVKTNATTKSIGAPVSFRFRTDQMDRRAKPATRLALKMRTSREFEVIRLPRRMPVETAAARMSRGLWATRGCAGMDMFSDPTCHVIEVIRPRRTYQKWQASQAKSWLQVSCSPET